MHHSLTSVVCLATVIRSRQNWTMRGGREGGREGGRDGQRDGGKRKREGGSKEQREKEGREGEKEGREDAREGGREAVVAREAGVVELPLGTGWCGWQQNMSRWQELVCGGWQHEATCEQ